MFKNAENWPFSLHKFSKYERSSQMSKSNFELSNLNLGRLVIKTFEIFSWHRCLDKNEWGSMILGKFLILQCTKSATCTNKTATRSLCQCHKLGLSQIYTRQEQKISGKTFLLVAKLYLLLILGSINLLHGEIICKNIYSWFRHV